ncbi:MAG: M4 family metallopeptidase, partial [Actinomycetota bacterium]|nr:M4 family metallopeptidase [Actinomycetota bacterium]
MAVLPWAGAERAGPAAAQPSTQAAALDTLARDSRGGLKLQRRPGSGPFHLSARIPDSRFTRSRTAAGRGSDFWAAYGPAFGIRDADSELRLRSAKTDGHGLTHLRYDQRHRGLAVYARQIVLHLGSAEVVAVNGDFEPSVDVGTTPSVSAAAAEQRAADSLRKRGAGRVTLDPELLVYADPARGDRLAWRVTVPTTRPFGLWRVFVDGQTGVVLSAGNDLHTARDRHTYTNNNFAGCNNNGTDCHLPGTKKLTEAGCIHPTTTPSCDVVLTKTHANTGDVYDYYSSRFGHDSYDDAGAPLRSTAHFGVRYDNAFWCPTECMDALFAPGHQGGQMVYGDGSWNGTTGQFSPLGEDLDVVTHELTHAVTSSEADLVYEGQSGALNEGYSDIFAAFNDNDGDRWLIGEQSYTPGTPGDALRNVQNPGSAGQPGHMSDYVNTLYDNRGVHYNSTIPSHVAYLIAEGAPYSVGLAIAEDLHYCALTSWLFPDADFAANLAALKTCAQLEYPDDPAVEAAVVKANAAVGIVGPPTILLPDGSETLQASVPAAIEWDTNGAAGLTYRAEAVADEPGVDLTQGFESGAGLPTGFQTSGDAPWAIDPAKGASGARSIRSGSIGDMQRSQLSYTARMNEAGFVRFKVWVSTEQNYDFFTMHVDGVWMPPELSGVGTQWVEASVPLEAGVHTITWVFEKDGSDPPNPAVLDRIWIDDLVIPGGAAAPPTTIVAATAPDATSHSWTPSAAGAFRVRLTALGNLAPWLASAESALFTVDVAPPPAVSVGDAVSLEEGDSGTKTMSFPVTLAHASEDPVTVDYVTVNNLASAYEEAPDFVGVPP